MTTMVPTALRAELMLNAFRRDSFSAANKP
jgi:hypothetical protein